MLMNEKKNKKIRKYINIIWHNNLFYLILLIKTIDFRTLILFYWSIASRNIVFQCNIDRKKSRRFVLLITCKFKIPNELTRKNKSITMNRTRTYHSQIQLVILSIHAYNSIIHKREKKFNWNTLILSTSDIDP
jgi:hypothetical protein